MLEKIIPWHLLSLVTVYVAIHSNQHIFWAGSSTDSALYALVSNIEESVSKGEFALGFFLDNRAAFDSLSYGVNLGALLGAGVENVVLNLILSLLYQQEIVVTWNGVKCCSL